VSLQTDLVGGYQAKGAGPLLGIEEEVLDLRSGSGDILWRRPSWVRIPPPAPILIPECFALYLLMVWVLDSKRLWSRCGRRQSLQKSIGFVEQYDVLDANIDSDSVKFQAPRH